MHKPTQNEKVCSLKDLTRGPTSMVPTCYLAWMSPKSQNEAIKMIYNKRNTININPKPVIESRKCLCNAGYLRRLTGDKNKIKNVRFMSTAKPYLEYLGEELERIESRYQSQFTEKVKKAIEIIYESKWFRRFFENKFIENEYCPCWYIGRDSKDRLIVDDALYSISSLLSDLATISLVFKNYLHSIDIELNTPTIERVVEAEDFDALTQELSESYSSDIIAEMYAKILEEFDDTLTFIRVAKKAPLIIPDDVMHLFRRAGRSTHTLRLTAEKEFSLPLAEDRKILLEDFKMLVETASTKKEDSAVNSILWNIKHRKST